ncbi:hypothetical protein [Pelagibacterium luteolum]|uniref:hypothetical protein n=1 Tax=Pelagibacterium luteolum TaxID=440168 RepID=UPI00115F88BF|nr:hypothetical protein [Pelagibacterium luteolum]
MKLHLGIALSALTLMAASPAFAQSRSIDDLMSDAQEAEYCAGQTPNTTTTTSITLPWGETVSGSVRCDSDDHILHPDDRLDDHDYRKEYDEWLLGDDHDDDDDDDHDDDDDDDDDRYDDDDDDRDDDHGGHYGDDDDDDDRHDNGDDHHDDDDRDDHGDDDDRDDDDRDDDRHDEDKDGDDD